MKPAAFESAMEFGFIMGDIVNSVESDDNLTTEQKLQLYRFAADCILESASFLMEKEAMSKAIRKDAPRGTAPKGEPSEKPCEKPAGAERPAEGPAKFEVPAREAPKERKAADAPGSLNVRSVIDAIIAGEDRADEFLDNIKRMFAEGR